MPDTPPRPCLSVIIPVYNEAANLPGLGAEVAKAMAGLGRSWEVIFVDDGSSDASYAVIQEMTRRHPGCKGLRLGRNVGQTGAISAGIAQALGEVIALLDGDGQNDPRDIPALLAEIDAGYDVVSGWRKDRQDPGLTRVLPSRIANRIISWITGVSLHDYGCTLKLYRSRYLKSVRLYGEMHRFIPAYAGFLGARIKELPVHHRPRTRGVSKYGLSRTFKVVLDLITVKFMDAYMSKPLYLFGGSGLVMGATGLLMAAYTLYHKFHGHVFVKDQPLFLVSIFCALAGLQLLLLGLVAEILVRVYFDIKDKRPYFIRETVGFD